MYSPLLTDLYQLTMAYGYWKLNMHEREAVFHLIYRSNPFKGNYAVACGLGSVIDFIHAWHFSADDLTYLASLKAPNGSALFEPAFLTYLGQLRFTGNIDAIPEGTVVFPHEPLLRVTGPLLQGQLIESALLNMMNFQTLVATKAARVYQAAEGEPVFEFGMRRAQGPDGALSASRAAYIGGCAATSNVLAGKLYDIPVRGTHAHSWVTAFPDEMSAFLAYAKVMPQNCVLLVDTYDTVNGVKHAIEIGKKLRQQGAELLGIRLDSGDLAALSIKARQLLDEAGFSNTQVIVSNSLSENVIQQLKQQHAEISIWGVGTNLVTAYDHAALDGVYKLSALRREDGSWEYKLKLSEQAVKISNPGVYQIRRFYHNKKQVMDIMYDVERGIPEHPEMNLSEEPYKRISLGAYDSYEDLLQPVLRQGQLVGALDSIHVVRERAIRHVAEFLQTQGDQVYSVGLEKGLYDLKQSLILALKKANQADS